MSLFSVLTIATRGLQASQLAMDVSSQNISNADVEGYSRKRLNTTADYRTDGTFGQMGFGVNVIDIERMRNTFIDEQIRQALVILRQQIGVVLENPDHVHQQIAEIARVENSEPLLVEIV